MMTKKTREKTTIMFIGKIKKKFLNKNLRLTDNYFLVQGIIAFFI